MGESEHFAVCVARMLRQLLTTVLSDVACLLRRERDLVSVCTLLITARAILRYNNTGRRAAHHLTFGDAV